MYMYILQLMAKNLMKLKILVMNNKLLTIKSE